MLYKKVWKLETAFLENLHPRRSNNDQASIAKLTLWQKTEMKNFEADLYKTNKKT